jgi:hypothetical protein
MLVHGNNLLQKETHPKKYRDKTSKQYLVEIRARYDKWKKANETIVGPLATKSTSDGSIIKKRVEAFVQYKDFIDQQKYAEQFDARSNLHSSVLEEFIYFLFRDLVKDFGHASCIGKANTLKDLFFAPGSYEEMIRSPHARFEGKDHDFVIGATASMEIRCLGEEKSQTEQIELPAIAIECKTYLDKSMLEASSNAAEQIKARTPNAIYIIVSEWLKLTEDINLKKYKVEQIYVLRRQKNTDREDRYHPSYDKKPISVETVIHLYETVRDHLTSPWLGGVKHGLDKGYLL